MYYVQIFNTVAKKTFIFVPSFNLSVPCYTLLHSFKNFSLKLEEKKGTLKLDPESMQGFPKIFVLFKFSKNSRECRQVYRFFGARRLLILKKVDCMHAFFACFVWTFYLASESKISRKQGSE